MSYISENAGITNGAKIRALKELECMNEAMCEMEREGATAERKEVLWHELSARVWAGIYALQYMDMPKQERPGQYDDVMQSASMFDCTGSIDDQDESGLFDDEKAEVH